MQNVGAKLGMSLRFQVAEVNTASRWGIKQLGISFSSIFLLFSYEKVARGHIHNSRGKNPGPRLLMTALCQGIVCDINPALCRYLCICCRGCCVNSLITERSHSFSVLNMVIHYHLV